MINDLKVGEKLIVCDNSYCYEIVTIDEGVTHLENAWLHPNYCPSTKSPLNLEVVAITDETIVDGVFKYEGQVAEVEDEDGKHFLVGVCWDRRADDAWIAMEKMFEDLYERDFYDDYAEGYDNYYEN